ncbi:MAG TPA: hypothetical protein VHL14_04130 [Steroidobacteraceae bacterium]|nr:hypothetical protein [Steroidobacteraceae bacterium]
MTRIIAAPVPKRADVALTSAATWANSHAAPRKATWAYRPIDIEAYRQIEVTEATKALP